MLGIPTRRTIVPILLVLLAAGLLLARPIIGNALRPLVVAERRAELALAWPVLRARASLDQWRAIRASGAAPVVSGAAAAGNVPSFAAWRAQPVQERWSRYESAEWRDVRLATRLTAAGMLVAIVLAGGRLVVWPLLRGGWFVAALVLIQRPGRPGTSHGSARWASGRELRGRRPRPGAADLVVGRVGRAAVAVHEADQYEHLMLVAPTGAGKTSGLILPNLLREPGTRSLVVTDPKRELLRLTSPYLRSVYGEGNVLAIDLLDPALSAGYNPLAQVVDAASADLFAQTWVRNTGTSKEPFWDNAARTLLGAAALHLVKAEEGVVPPLSSLLDFLCGQPAEEVTEALADSPVPEARRLARGFLTNMAKNERLVGSVFAELPPRFACLNLESVRRVTGVNEVDPSQLVRVPTAVYLALDLDHARTLAPLTACFFRDLFATLAAVAKAQPDGCLPTPVLAYLDEFGTIGHVPEFQSRLATVRSARIGCLLVVQDLAQLTKEYGKEDADTILTNATTKLCLAGVTHDDAEYFSKLAGTTTVHSTNRGSTHPLLLPWADRGNRGVGEVARPLITPDELRTLGDDVLVVAGRHHPVRARQARYYQDKALRSRLPDPARGDPLDAFRRRRMARPLPLPGGGTEEFLPEVVPPPTPHRARRTPARTPAAAPSPHAGRDAPARAAPVAVAAPPPTAVAAPPAFPPHDQGPPVLTDTQRTIVAALAATGRPGSEVSSSDLALVTGLGRHTVRQGLAEIRAMLGLGQWDDIAEAARRLGLIEEEGASTEAPATLAGKPVADLTAGEVALLRAIAAAPGATSTGWAVELGVSPSRVRQLLGALRQKCGAATTEALVAMVRDGRSVTSMGERK
jgi:type IV secretory pathway TraG/TraD family ATPase VirD4/DNA-binding CsgD family transcriptional regulator